MFRIYILFLLDVHKKCAQWFHIQIKKETKIGTDLHTGDSEQIETKLTSVEWKNNSYVLTTDVPQWEYSRLVMPDQGPKAILLYQHMYCSLIQIKLFVLLLLWIQIICISLQSMALFRNIEGCIIFN